MSYENLFVINDYNPKVQCGDKLSFGKINQNYLAFKTNVLQGDGTLANEPHWAKFSAYSISIYYYVDRD